MIMILKIINEEFIKKNKIDIIVHGFYNDNDENKQLDFFKTAIKLNKFKKMPYFELISTTKIINKIKKYY